MSDADIIKLNEILKGLIYDRTQSDVDYALNLERNGIYSDENLRGAYNVSDRNRVGGAVNFIIECLKNTGTYEVLGSIVREDWNAYDIIVPEDNRKTLDALSNLKRLLPYGGIQEVPESLDGLTYQKANAVEGILSDLYGVFARLLDSWLYCGDGYLSDFDPFNRQGWDDCQPQ